MSSALQFETPENVSIDFEPAGLGTRFVAWLVDQIFVWLLTFLLLIVLIAVGASVQGITELMEGLGEEDSDTIFYAVGFIALVWGLGSFVYFGACELLMRGQTPGKRLSQIRVVKADGFALDASGILVRNVFRVLDHIPMMWIVPLLSARGQRTGDMVAGTVVVSDASQVLGHVRTELADRSALESEFQFDSTALQKLDSTDVQGIEMLLERRGRLSEDQSRTLVTTMIDALTNKLSVDPPGPDQKIRFLEDLLAAELRRQQRGLG